MLASHECLFPLHSDSPYSEHGTLEEVDQDAGTETHTSEDGMPRVHAIVKLIFVSFLRTAYIKNSVETRISIKYV